MRNPVDLNVSVGGSSCGSAAVCAACGPRLVAWPSIARISGGDTLVAHVEGPIARTVADLGAMMGAGRSRRPRSELAAVRRP